MSMHKMKNTVIRKLEKSDIAACINLFRETVHFINAKDYSHEQLEIWAPKTIDPENQWWLTLLENIALVAVMNNEIVGFTDLSNEGYLDRLFVHKEHQRKGIAKALINELERLAVQRSITEITTEASITAKPFFAAMGYQVVKEQQKEHKGIKFINFVMRKKIT